jgi:hypothetical protein
MNLNKSPTILADTLTESNFTSLAWSNFNPEEYSMGIIAAGTDDGLITLWDPSAIVEYYKSDEA